MISNRSGNGPIRIWLAANRIIDSCDPHPGALFLKRQVGVFQHRNAVRGESLADMLFTRPDVVISEDRVTLRTLDPTQQTPALPGRLRGEIARQYLSADVVPCQKNHIELDPVDLVDRLAQQKRLGELVQMNVA